MSIFIKMKEMKGELSRTEEKIADYIENNLSKIRLINTYELAENSGVSQASIVRFAKKMGFSGFPEFRISLVEDMGNTNKSSSSYEKKVEIERGDNLTKNFARTLLQKNIMGLEQSHGMIDFKKLEEIVEVLKSSKRIFLIGDDSSNISARYFQSCLLGLGLNAIFDSNNLYYLPYANEEDVVFIMMQKAKNPEIYNVVKKLKEKNVKIISITGATPNFLTEISDIYLQTSAGKVFSSSFQKIMIELSFLELIYAKLAI